MIKRLLDFSPYLPKVEIECMIPFFLYKANKTNFLSILPCLISEKLICFLLNFLATNQNHLGRYPVFNLIVKLPTFKGKHSKENALSHHP